MTWTVIAVSALVDVAVPCASTKDPTVTAARDVDELPEKYVVAEFTVIVPVEPSGRAIVMVSPDTAVTFPPRWGSMTVTESAFREVWSDAIVPLAETVSPTLIELSEIEAPAFWYEVELEISIVCQKPC
jgi:hypothetical protein